MMSYFSSRLSSQAARIERGNGLISRGFTLIEVMVVVVILAILATIVVPKIMDRPDDARIAKAKQDIRAIDSALQLYKLDNLTYPTTDQGLEALVKPPANAKNWRQGGYLDRLPIDPWNNPYQYLSPGQHGAFDVYSLGADGQPGGTGADADIGNWQEEGGATNTGN
ncbi:type II secretion system major pseudopilin GspG [Halothiobacillus neapolitanus]|jgi:general secretion pathway protein G|uniref:Type II secretion system core protein G n=1 Tax=Halothiobacillus neapolitanus (strain ATCC 23641 / DSM 15147 / CIP 104769 / NCIMB 8539 / c2) TaxID=555778 RepID=D0KWL1_HALNC|nr:general secretion pathway protein G [Halothiobacillus neapolitanus c2]OZB84427.1 MAG: type II secretion system protein GspG [Halothiobacillus sp. 13-55-253]TDN61040.1 general secretion pathway protein G [Halothiobacillus neapolitanus]